VLGVGKGNHDAKVGGVKERVEPAAALDGPNVKTKTTRHLVDANTHVRCSSGWRWVRAYRAWNHTRLRRTARDMLPRIDDDRRPTIPRVSERDIDAPGMHTRCAYM
jgi:hypothetical protein